MSVISLQAGAAEQLLDRDPDRAHLQAVMRTTSEALAEMRRLMGVLEQDETHDAPQPGLARLPDLVAQASFPVALREDRARRPSHPAWTSRPTGWCKESMTDARMVPGG